MGRGPRRRRPRGCPLGSALIGAATVALAAVFLAWPLAVNTYPIVFSDTGGLLDMGLIPSMGWDKPFLYGPFAALTSGRTTLTATAAVQSLLLSYMLWATQAAFAPPRASRHLVLCLVLAVFTTAPWFAVTIMPDAFTPLVALGIATALGTLPRRHAATVFIVTAAAIAAHLSHLVLAAGMIGAVALLRARIPWRPVLSLVTALLFLFATNVVGRGQLAISPYGSVFALARLIGDGPARDYLAHVCPDPAIMLCDWRTRLTDDSDQFLWDPASPFWSDPLPLPEFARQASAIVAGTLRTEPVQVLRFVYRNAAAQLIRVDLGDTLVSDFLADTVRPRLQRWYPRAELARFDGSRQAGGSLAPFAAVFVPLHRIALLVSASACAVLLIRGLQRPGRRADLAALVLIALAANAVSTGALSAVHDRYAARLAWILLLPPLFGISEPARWPRNQPPASP